MFALSAFRAPRHMEKGLMLSSMVLILTAATGVTGLDIEGLPCPNPVSAWSGTTNAGVYDMAVDGESSLFFCGYFFGGSDLDPTEGVYEPIPEPGTRDGFVTKVNADGSFAWAYTVGGAEGDVAAKSVTIDQDGSVVVAGTFEGAVDFDPGPETDEHTALGDCAAFITRLSPEGAYISTFTFGGPGDVTPGGVGLDPEGNILVVGFFYGTIDFDPGPTSDVRSGISDVYVSKLGPDGSHLWTHTLGGGAFDAGKNVAVDSDGNIFATGTFRGTVDFDPSPGGRDEHTVVGSVDNIFVTKYYPDGSYAWTATYDAQHPGIGNGIAIGPAGGVVLTGLFRHTVDFDPGEGVDLRTAHNPESDLGDIFVTSLDASGSYEWTYTVGGSNDDSGYGVAVDRCGNVFVTGVFRETVDFDPGLRTDLYVTRGLEDMFVTKLSSDGTYRWTRVIAGDSNDSGRDVRVDAHGSLYLLGYFRLYIDLDPGCEVDIHEPHDAGSLDKSITRLICPAQMADFDANGVVDLRDVAHFQRCFTDEGPATCGDGCSRLDLHPDDDIDLDDFFEFHAALTGP